MNCAVRAGEPLSRSQARSRSPTGVWERDGGVHMPIARQPSQAQSAKLARRKVVVIEVPRRFSVRRPVFTPRKHVAAPHFLDGGQPALSRTSRRVSAGFSRTSYQNGAAVTLQMAQSSTPEAGQAEAWCFMTALNSQPRSDKLPACRLRARRTSWQLVPTPPDHARHQNRGHDSPRSPNVSGNLTPEMRSSRLQTMHSVCPRNP